MRLLTLLPLLLLAGLLCAGPAAYADPASGSSKVGDADHSADPNVIEPDLTPQGAPTGHSEWQALYGLEQDGPDQVLPLFEFEDAG
ncbi:MAG: hypothetical protein ABI743_14150, partial [bacterium]